MSKKLSLSLLQMWMNCHKWSAMAVSKLTSLKLIYYFSSGQALGILLIFNSQANYRNFSETETNLQLIKVYYFSYCFKELPPGFIDLFFVFIGFYFIYFCSNLYDFFPSAGFVSFFFKILFIWEREIQREREHKRGWGWGGRGRSKIGRANAWTPVTG